MRIDDPGRIRRGGVMVSTCIAILAVCVSAATNLGQRASYDESIVQRNLQQLQADYLAQGGLELLTAWYARLGATASEPVVGFPAPVVDPDIASYTLVSPFPNRTGKWVDSNGTVRYRHQLCWDFRRIPALDGTFTLAAGVTVHDNDRASAQTALGPFVARKDKRWQGVMVNPPPGGPSFDAIPPTLGLALPETPQGPTGARALLRDADTIVAAISMMDRIEKRYQINFVTATFDRRQPVPPPWPPPTPPLPRGIYRLSDRGFAQGLGRRAMITTGFHDRDPFVVPGGRRIAFARQLGVQWQIFDMNLDGTDPRQLTNDNWNSVCPVVRPDGRVLLYSVPSRHEIRQIAYPPPPGPAFPSNPVLLNRFSPTWANDGGGNQEDNSVTTRMFAPDQLAISPDGLYLAFRGLRGNAEPCLYIYKLSTGPVPLDAPAAYPDSVMRYTAFNYVDVSHPSFSPNPGLPASQQYLLFANRRNGPAGWPIGEIVRMTYRDSAFPSGMLQNGAMSDNNSTILPLTNDSFQDLAPRYLPSGQSSWPFPAPNPPYETEHPIVWLSLRYGGWNMMVMRPRDSFSPVAPDPNPVVVTTGFDFDVFPAPGVPGRPWSFHAGH